MKSLALTAAVLTIASAGVWDSVRPHRQESALERLFREPAIRAMVRSLEQTEARVIEDQIRLCEIPAPPFKEQARGEAYRKAFESLGLSRVRIDAVGNVIGDRPGAAARPRLVFSAHLDTVFPEGTPVRTTREGSIIKGPGIADDCRGLAVVLGVVRALNEQRIQTPGTITFVGTVGEEGLGDLRGVRHLFEGELKGQVDAFVSVDGAGLGVTHVAVGSLRYKATFKGPGGHSYGGFGIANPAHALGRAIARIGDLQVPREPRTTFAVGRVGGGTSVNSIPSEAWLEMDMRSSDPAALRALDAAFQKALDAAAAEENARWGGRGRLVVEKTLVGQRPSGRVSSGAPIVQAAVAATRALGLEASLGEGSTDANVPIGLGIPAVTIDGGGSASGVHSPAEAFDLSNAWQGTARAALLAIALARQP